ncbi:hypothetical protein BD309DRAFT_954111 [Dichomitus squalens]|nr:hypothetical protein BD309DRAFT_954111 [Dichomitus squalens]
MPPTRCYQCRRDFTSLHRARQHVCQLGYTAGIGFVCPVCDRTFDETAQYTHHIAIPYLRCAAGDDRLRDSPGAHVLLGPVDPEGGECTKACISPDRRGSRRPAI